MARVIGTPKKLAPTIGIAADHRCKNHSLEGPPNQTSKAGDSAPEELASATQVNGDYMPILLGKLLVEMVSVTDKMKAFKACGKLRGERMNARQVGARLKKAAEADKEEK